MAALCKGHLNSNCSQTVVLLLRKMNKKFKNGRVKALSSNQTYLAFFCQRCNFDYSALQCVLLQKMCRKYANRKMIDFYALQKSQLSIFTVILIQAESLARFEF